MLVTMLAGSLATVCVPFEWRPVSLGSFTASKASIVIPVRIDDRDKSVWLQLDTGASKTHLYGPANSERVARKVKVAVKGWHPTDLELETRPHDAALSADGPIGTAGVDMFPDGFVLDLRRAQLCPLTVSTWNWSPMTRVNGSPVITVNDGNDDLRLLLDTGSAAFTILSTPALSKGVAASPSLRTLSVPSFGRQLSVDERAPASAFKAFGSTLRLKRVYAFNDPDIEAMLKGAGINGLVGLASFNGKIAFDFANSRIAYAVR
jgi:hypothetical protein